MKQDYKKWCALITTLMLVFGVMVTGAMATTTTVGGAIFLDKIAVPSGGKVNITILGLDANGGVDVYGNLQGSEIQANIKSSLGGTFTSIASSGTFSASDPALTDGVLKGYLSYTAPINGTDTLTVILKEYINVSGGAPIVNIIDTLTQTITVSKSAISAKGLRIHSFTPVPGTKEYTSIFRGSNWNGADTATDFASLADYSEQPGVIGAMTAGTAGGQLKIWAVKSDGKTQDTSANGDVTVTFTPNKSGKDDLVGLNTAQTTYTFPLTMANGEAILTFTDSSIPQAGRYYVKAETEGFAEKLTSVQWSDEDGLFVNPKTDNKTLAIASEKAIINSTGIGSGFRAYMLDALGNKTTVSEANKTKNIRLTDTGTAGVYVSYMDGKFTYQPGKNYWTATIGNANSLPDKTGTAALVASMDSVTSSDPVNLKVVKDNLVASLPATQQKAGAAFDLTVSKNVAGTPISTSDTSLTIKHFDSNGSLKETKTATVKANTTKASVKFETSTSTGGLDFFIVSDNNIGDARADSLVNDLIAPADPYAGKVVNGNGETASIWPNVPGDAKTFKVFEKQVKLTDIYGNTNNKGNVVVSSAKASETGNTLVVGGTGATPAVLTYTQETLSFTDTPKFVFSGAGVSVPDLTLNVTVAAKASSLTKLVINSVQGENTLAEDSINLPLNATIPVTFEALDADGKGIDDKTVVYTVTGTVNPTVKAQSGDTLSSGSLVPFNYATLGRNACTLKAPNATGEFTITLKNANGTVTATKKFVVTKVVTADVGQEAGITEVAAALEAELSLYVNTTNPDGEAAVYEWFVFTATLAGDAAKLPLYLLATDGAIVAVEEGIDIYDYTFDYGDTDVAFIATLAMADLGLSTGDVFAYAYAYQNEGGDIYLPNVVFITVK
ncbi:MAG: hypothetical protein AB7S77_00175 [Desulfatirhabdiaceae bacterium]